MTTNGTIDRLPPYSKDAERSVIGSILRNPDALDAVMHVAPPCSFYTDGHQKIMRIIALMADQRKPITLVSVAEALIERHWIEDIGGHAYLAELYDANPTGAQAEYYAKIVRERAANRNLIHLCNDLANQAYEMNEPAEQLLARAEAEVLSLSTDQTLGDTVSLGNAVNSSMKRMDERAHRKMADRLLLTGFCDIDELTAGLHDGELTIIAARPSVGKTSLALSILGHLCIGRGYPVFFVTLEQTRDEIAERYLSAFANVSCHAIRKGRINDIDTRAIVDAADKISLAPLELDDTVSQNVMRIASSARRLKKRLDIRAAVIDYLQLIEPENRRENRNEQVSQITRRLKFLARELKIPVICLSQLNRDATKDTRPRLQHLRDSGGIEQDADCVWLLHRDDEQPGIVEVDIAKQRSGPTGIVKLNFNRQLMRFENFAPEIG